MPVVPSAAPTPSAVPAPTATEVPADLSTLSWLTAKQAAQLALMEVDGEVYSITGHGTSAAGVLSPGDAPDSEPSPGAGYSRDWSVVVRSGGETIHCSILIGDTLCMSGNAVDAGISEVGSVEPDSTNAFERFESANNVDWQALMVNDDVSILFELYGSSGESLDDPPFPVWTAYVTVNDLNVSPRGGQFNWNIEADTITSSVY